LLRRWRGEGTPGWSRRRQRGSPDDGTPMTPPPYICLTDAAPAGLVRWLPGGRDATERPIATSPSPGPRSSGEAARPFPLELTRSRRSFHCDACPTFRQRRGAPQVRVVSAPRRPFLVLTHFVQIAQATRRRVVTAGLKAEARPMSVIFAGKVRRRFSLIFVFVVFSVRPFHSRLLRRFEGARSPKMSSESSGWGLVSVLIAIKSNSSRDACA
jgi:hypothetical protein